MPGPKPPIVRWTEAERAALEQRTRAHKTAYPLVLRARIMLRLAAGHHAPEIARAFGTTRKTVRWWRRHGFARATWPLPARLQHDARPGAPALFTAAP